jgi:hypothetical protein
MLPPALGAALHSSGPGVREHEYRQTDNVAADARQIGREGTSR